MIELTCPIVVSRNGDTTACGKHLCDFEGTDGTIRVRCRNHKPSREVQFVVAGGVVRYRIVKKGDRKDYRNDNGIRVQDEI